MNNINPITKTQLLLHHKKKRKEDRPNFNKIIDSRHNKHPLKSAQEMPKINHLSQTALKIPNSNTITLSKKKSQTKTYKVAIWIEPYKYNPTETEFRITQSNKENPIPHKKIKINRDRRYLESKSANPRTE